jgi:nanoRNase/pAp phosphatase (c-di-AMP/oligoRNAs hydrolase)
VQTIVIGHRNPDMDSVCSALAYARLKRDLGWRDVVAARAISIRASSSSWTNLGRKPQFS